MSNRRRKGTRERKRKSLFVKGNRFWFVQGERRRNVAEETTDASDDSQRLLKRMDKGLFDLARLPGEVVLPASLRPTSSRPIESEMFAIADKTDKLLGNCIVHIGSTEIAFNKSVREHLKGRPNCPGTVILDPGTYHRKGLGVKAGMKCTLCEYKSTELMKFYEEVKSDKRPGPRAVKMNVQLQVALTKEPIGNTAMRNILTTLDIAPPTEGAMQVMANQISAAYTEINQEQLSRNRKLIGKVMKIRKEGDTAPIAVAADGCYNNPPKGRHFYQPGTQSWCPMFCMEDGLEKPVAFSTRSKICSCPEAKLGRHLKTCTKTFPSHVAMGNSEKDMGKDCAEQIVGPSDGSELMVGTVIGDGDGHVAKGVQEAMPEMVIDRQYCARHLTKSISRNITNGTLQCLPGPTQALMKQQKRSMAKFIEKRCAWEYREAHKRYGNDLQRLVTKCEMIKRGIVACLQGDVQTCRRVSLVCKAHKQRQVSDGEDRTRANRVPYGLPNKTYVILTVADKRLIEKWVDNKLGAQAVMSQRLNKTTNRCESSHLTVLKSVPKSKTFCRNFAGRANSACHSMSLGQTRSVMAANKHLGVGNSCGSLAHSVRMGMLARELYHKARKRSDRYKAMAKRLRVLHKRCSMGGSASYAAGCQDPIVRQEHSYDMS